jgi:hypothetical protein
MHTNSPRPAWPPKGTVAENNLFRPQKSKRPKTDKLCSCVACGLIYVVTDREITTRPTKRLYEDGSVMFRGRACERCFGLKMDTVSEFRLVNL